MSKAIEIDPPKFETEGEEAQWWFDNREKVQDALIQAMDDDTIGRDTARRLTQQARSSGNVTIRMASSDMEMAREQAARAGVPCQAYIGGLLREALQRNRASRQ